LLERKIEIKRKIEINSKGKDGKRKIVILIIEYVPYISATRSIYRLDYWQDYTCS
jgi:hypothetical protein